MSSVTRPLRRDAELNRLRILDAASAVFAEDGLSATLDDVARRAGVGVGTVYRRFPDKDTLIDALFEKRLEEFSAIAQAALEHEDPWTGLTTFLEQAVDMQARDRGLKELLLSTDRGRDRIAGIRGRIAPIVSQVVLRAQEAGALRPDIGHTDVPMINLMLGTVADASRETAPELWRRYLQLFIDGLRADPQVREPLDVPRLPEDLLDATMQCWRPPQR